MPPMVPSAFSYSVGVPEEVTFAAEYPARTGTLMMTAVVRTDGTPGDIAITQSLDTEYGLDKQAVAALGQWRFDPGLKDGKPVPVRVTIEMRFWLKE